MIEAEAQHSDDSTSADRGQTRSPIVRRGLRIEERLAPGLELDVLDGDAAEGEPQMWMARTMVVWK
jgi:hypothetical protein